MIQFLFVSCWDSFSSRMVGLFHAEDRSMPESQNIVVCMGVCVRRNKTLRSFNVDFCDCGIFFPFPYFLLFNC